jgi:hypothetical protein
MGARRASGRTGRALRAGLAALLGAGLGLLASELAFRVLLFGELSFLAGIAAPLREPNLLSSPVEEDLNWILRHRFGRAKQDVAPRPDAELGWVTQDFDAATLEHSAESRLRGRRAVLLFGDSFVDCTTPETECFEGLALQTPLRAAALVLNHGVGGYGFDQVAILARRALVRWDQLAPAGGAAPRPVVGIGIYVEDDLDRMVLSLRGFPKPRFVLAGGALQLVPPASQVVSEHIAATAPTVPSWLWRLAVYGENPLPDWLERRLAALRQARADRHRERVTALCVPLLAELHRELETAGYEHFFLLLPGKQALGRPTWTWREPLLEDTLRQLGARYVNARLDFARDQSTHQRRLNEYFLTAGVGAGHYNRLGNLVALRTVLRALAGEDDGGSGTRPATLLGEHARQSLEAIDAQLAAPPVAAMPR